MIKNVHQYCFGLQKWVVISTLAYMKKVSFLVAQYQQLEACGTQSCPKSIVNGLWHPGTSRAQPCCQSLSQFFQHDVIRNMILPFPQEECLDRQPLPYPPPPSLHVIFGQVSLAKQLLLLKPRLHCSIWFSSLDFWNCQLSGSHFSKFNNSFNFPQTFAPKK